MKLNINKLFIERAKRDWTIKDLAKHAGVSPYAISNALHREVISASLAGKIARALEIDVEEIVIFED